MKPASWVSISSWERVNKLQSSTGTFKDLSSICKGCLEAPTLTYHAHAEGVWGWGGGLELITAETQFTDQYQPIRKLPAVESSLGMPDDLCP